MMTSDDRARYVRKTESAVAHTLYLPLAWPRGYEYVNVLDRVLIQMTRFFTGHTAAFGWIT